MPLQLTPAFSSRITKRTTSKPSLSRASSSPFASSSRKKPGQGQRPSLQKSQSTSASGGGATAQEGQGIPTLQVLNDNGPVTNLSAMYATSASQTGPSDSEVLIAFETIANSIFDDIPPRAGMNSTRIAEVLNYRRALPPIVNIQHLHALLDDSTATEREVTLLIARGKLRRILVPGRGGNGMEGIGDCLVKTSDFEMRVKASPALSPPLQQKFLTLTRKHPKSISVQTNNFTAQETTSLLKAGFLVSSTPTRDNLNMTRTSSKAHNSLFSLTTPNPSPTTQKNQELLLSLPNLGPYLRLLSSSRTHLLTLLSTRHTHTSPTHAPCLPLSLLRDLWNGHLDLSTNSAFSAKRIRGEFEAEVLPAKTKRWKVLYGVGFEWVLGECVGAGLVEVFETGSVGWGVRLM